MKKYNLIPLKQFYCDTCGGIITDIDHGWVEWLSDPNGLAYGFKIVHQRTFSTRKAPKSACYHHYKHEDLKDSTLSGFAHPDYGLSFLYELLDPGPYKQPGYTGPRVKDLREFTEFLRRLTIPYYEEARQWIDRATAEGVINPAQQNPYSVDTCKTLIERYNDPSGYY